MLKKSKNTQSRRNSIAKEASTTTTARVPKSNSNEKSLISLANPQSKYRIAKFTKIIYQTEELSGPKLQLEVEGFYIYSRGKSKGITYFECSSHRQVNTPACNFRARIKDFDSSHLEGEIEISADHSPTCKFVIGNKTTNFSKNSSLNINKANYKTMKCEIEKQLEEKNWLTPGEILSWMKENFTVEKLLSYSQVDDIVQYWRRKNNVYQESYIFQHTLNKSGLPFFRTYFTLQYKKNNVNKLLKIIIWASDFQINRLRLTNHWFVDGTFTITPCGFSQLVTFMIRDPNTGFVKPGLWALLNSKDEESYYHLFRIVQEILSSSQTLQWKLSSCTLDFEDGLINGFSRVFSDAHIIGCLFHLKQALFRESQSLGLMKNEIKEETKVVIDALGSLSWDNIIDVEKKFEEIMIKYENGVFKDLVIYYRKNWLSKLKSGMINYSQVEDEFRANSVIEKYNCHIKDSLPRSPSWPKFIEFLVKEEFSYVNETFLAEQRGQIAFKSRNFGKTFLPKPLKVNKKNRKNTTNLNHQEKAKDNRNPNKRKFLEISESFANQSESQEPQTKNLKLNSLNENSENISKEKITYQKQSKKIAESKSIKFFFLN